MKRRERERRGILQVETSSVVELDGGAIIVSNRAPVPLAEGKSVVHSRELRIGTFEAPTTLEERARMSS